MSQVRAGIGLEAGGPAEDSGTAGVADVSREVSWVVLTSAGRSGRSGRVAVSSREAGSEGRTEAEVEARTGFDVGAERVVGVAKRSAAQEEEPGVERTTTELVTRGVSG